MAIQTETSKNDSFNLSWQKAVAKYRNPEFRRSIWQIANTIPPYFAVVFIMVRSLEISYWLTLALAPLAAGLLARTFIIFHDCGHGSFFKSQRANDILGFLTGVLTFTPYHYWKHNHAIHHATAGDLDRRGTGDVMTLTVKEYLALPPIKRLGYRIMRNPIMMFLIGPLVVFLIVHRFVRGEAGRRERYSVYWTNLSIAGYVALMILAMGLEPFLLVQLPIVIITFSCGVWLFYVQHQFEGTYWEDTQNWDYATAALKGSSYYKLPKVLQWFTGNIGFHHIHHLSPRIPNYLLEKCYNENKIFQEIEPVTLRSSLKSLSFRLWDEDKRKLVGFDSVKEYQWVASSVRSSPGGESNR
jgi:omega-6 fatty acid desaturase (delta-12 desaturase)